MEYEKQCTRCNRVQPLESYHRLKKGRFGRHAHCKTCRKVKKKNGTPRPTTGFKQCPRCQTQQPVSEFDSDKHTKKGLQTYCKKCHGMAYSQWASTHPYLSQLPFSYLVFIYVRPCKPQNRISTNKSPHLRIFKIRYV